MKFCYIQLTAPASLCLPPTSQPRKFQHFPGPCTEISGTFQDQTHFPALSRAWKFYQKNPGLSRRRGNRVYKLNVRHDTQLAACKHRKLNHNSDCNKLQHIFKK